MVERFIDPRLKTINIKEQLCHWVSWITENIIVVTPKASCFERSIFVGDLGLCEEYFPSFLDVGLGGEHV